MHLLELFEQSIGQGKLQATEHKLLGSDNCKTDTGHYHVKTGQTEKGSLWSTVGKENGKSAEFQCYAHYA